MDQPCPQKTRVALNSPLLTQIPVVSRAGIVSRSAPAMQTVIALAMRFVPVNLQRKEQSVRTAGLVQVFNHILGFYPSNKAFLFNPRKMIKEPRMRHFSFGVSSWVALVYEKPSTRKSAQHTTPG